MKSVSITKEKVAQSLAWPIFYFYKVLTAGAKYLSSSIYIFLRWLAKVKNYSACPNNRGGIVELSGAGNPKNLTTIKGGARRFTFLRSKKNVFLRQVL